MIRTAQKPAVMINSVRVRIYYSTYSTDNEVNALNQHLKKQIIFVLCKTKRREI